MGRHLKVVGIIEKDTHKDNADNNKSLLVNDVPEFVDDTKDIEPLIPENTFENPIVPFATDDMISHKNSQQQTFPREIYKDQSVQNDVKYSCSQCEYQTARRFNLQKH